MITSYIDQALRRAHYSNLENGTFCATVPALSGVIATGPTLEECRDQLAEVVEEWGARARRSRTSRASARTRRRLGFEGSSSGRRESHGPSGNGSEALIERRPEVLVA
jgi:predicted RNase H-like HicB family nuclease